MDIGEIVLYSGILLMLSKDLLDLLQGVFGIQQNRCYMDIRDEFMNLNEESSPRENATATNTITFSNVSFSYETSDNCVLNNINHTFVTNKKIAIVGENGSGKTTFAKLLCGLYTPSEGLIYYNDKEQRDLSKKSIYDLFGVVF